MKKIISGIRRFLIHGLGPVTRHYEIMVPDQAEIVYRDSTTAIIQRGGEA